MRKGEWGREVRDSRECEYRLGRIFYGCLLIEFVGKLGVVGVGMRSYM